MFTKKFAKKVLLGISCALALFANHVLTAIDKSEKKFNDLLYCSARHMLYSQDEIVSTIDFKNASRARQEAMLEQHFHAVKESALLKLFGGAALKVGLTGVLPAYLVFRLARTQQAGVVMGVGVAALTLFNSVVAMLAKEINEKIEFLWSFLTDHVLPRLHITSSVQENGLLPLEELEITYVRHKPWINPVLQDKIEDTLIGFYCEAGRESSGLEHQPDAADVIRTALAVPTKIKCLTYDEKIIETAFAGYTKELRDNLKLFCMLHVASARKRLPLKKLFYFHGEHGLGKGRAAKHIAYALGLPCATIQFTNRDDLVGDRTKPGALLNALTKTTLNGKGAANMILFIDEADKILSPEANSGKGNGTGDENLGAMRAFLLSDLFDPDKQTFYSPYLDMHIDISHLGIIVAGNEPIRQEMEDRFRVVEFPGFTTKEKQAIVESTLLDRIFGDMGPEEDLGFVARETDQETEKKCEEDQAFTVRKAELIKEDYDNIRTIVAGDTNPGLRRLQAKLEDYQVLRSVCNLVPSDHLAECVRTLVK